MIGTKWIFRNKLDESEIMSINKAKLVAKRCNKKEGIYYDETFAPVAILEAIHMLLPFASRTGIKLFQIDV